MNTILVFLKSKKFLVGFAVVAVLAVIEFGYPVYRDWKFDRELQQLTDEINRPYLEDMHGGETPKETLEMFIAAVEGGDYDLASKYFVLSKQEEWRNTLYSAQKENKLNILMSEVKKTNQEITKEEPIWESREAYVFINSNSVSFGFSKYPQGIWKIKEI